MIEYNKKIQGRTQKKFKGALNVPEGGLPGVQLYFPRILGLYDNKSFISGDRLNS